MESSFLTTEMARGNLGAISRRIPGMVIEPVNIVDDGSVAFGFPLFMTTEGLASGVVDGEVYTPADFHGVCYRAFPVRQTANGLPDPKQTQGSIRVGYTFMKKAETDITTIKDGMPVYVVVGTAGKHKVLGEVVGAADGDNTIQINANFLGEADSNNIIEVAVGIG